MASFLGEIKRRKIFQVAAVYAVVAWLLVQIVATVEAPLSLPDWVDTLVIVLLAVGFPIAVILAWVFDIKSSGIERTAQPASVDSSPAETMPAKTGLAINLAVVGVLSLILVIAGSYVYLRGGLAGTAADGSDMRSIAVLPLTTQSVGEENAEFFAAGIHDQLLTQLARIGSLKVISRTSVMEYADTTKNMRDIGAELGVATILEGSVQQAGNMVLMNVQLIDAETDAHLWAQDYERELTVENIFAIQRETATAIASALEAAILPEEAERLREVPTLSRRALDFYLTGNEYLQNPDDRTYARRAVRRYELAVDEDPNFALAWAALGRAHSRVYLYAVDRSDSRLELARTAIERAFELAPNLPEAHLAFGDYYYHGFRDYERSLEHYALAERAMSGSAELYESLAYVNRRMGRWDDAVDNFARAAELDPRNLGLIFQQGATLRGLRRYEDADRRFDRVLEIDPTNGSALRIKALNSIFRDGSPLALKEAAAGAIDFPRRQFFGWFAAYFDDDHVAAISYLDAWEEEFDVGQTRYLPVSTYYGMTHRNAGELDRAREYFSLAYEQLGPILEENPEDPRVQMSLATILAGLDDPEDAAQAARRSMELAPDTLDVLLSRSMQQSAMLDVFAPIGDFDNLFAELERYLDSFGPWSIEGIARHPNLRSAVNDPRFDDLMNRYAR
jgi:TolB-like protein/Flp pilus assembly protein TadD